MACIVLPANSLVVLCGVPGCGKSTFAAWYFSNSAIVSSDRCRLLVSDSETNLAASREAFKLFYYTIERRLSLGRLTVADSTALTARARANLLRLGRKYGFYVALIIFNLPVATCIERNFSRQRKVITRVIEDMEKKLVHTLARAPYEGFDAVFVLSEKELADEYFRLEVRKHEVTWQGPFDLFGEVSGFYRELLVLLKKLGYRRAGHHFAHLRGRRAVFLGGTGGLGPRNLDTFWLVKSMVDAGTALYIPGDFCHRVYSFFEQNEERLAPEIEKFLDEWKTLPADERENFKEEFLNMYRSAPPYLILDGGKLAVFNALNQIDTGGIDCGGEKEPLPYPLFVVYSRASSSQEPDLRGQDCFGRRYICLDRLWALRYPELEYVHV